MGVSFNAADLAPPSKPSTALPSSGAASRFVLAPGALIGAVGLLHRGDPTIAVPAVDWRAATVDVVIPACRDQATIVLCLAALQSQTRPPRRIVLVEDCSGARDGTVVLAREFAAANGVALDVIEQHGAGGRAASLHEQATRLDGDVMVVVDAHVVLDSIDYLERCVHELYEGSGIAAVCGTLLPLRDSDRRRWAMSDAFRRWLGGDAWRDPLQATNRWRRIGHRCIDAGRECTALVQQRFIQRGQMRAFGGICHPHGAVAYRRRYLAALLERYGTDAAQTVDGGSEDILIGFALANEGFRTVQVDAPLARMRLGYDLAALPRLRMHYVASFLRIGCRFGSLLHPPSVAPSRWWSQTGGRGQRRAQEPYRQAFGDARTRTHGRPVGWAFACSMLDKTVVPLLALAVLATGHWRWLVWGAAVETVLWLAVLVAVAPSARGRRLLTGLAVAPLRYLGLLADLAGVAVYLWTRRAVVRLSR